MADKLSWTELRRLLANRAGVSEKEANLFLNAFNTQIIEALKQDKQVKINGLGTFKLQSVAPRKSVNVTTGEEIIIEGYNKIAFAPEVGVKELVEKTSLVAEQSSAASLATENIDPLQKLGEQAAEIVDLLADLGQAVKTEEPIVEPKPIVEPEPIIEPTPIIEPEPIIEPTPIVEPKPIIEPKPIVPPTPAPVSTSSKKEKKSHTGWKICIAILLCLLIAGGVGYYFFPQYIEKYIECAKAYIQPTEVTPIVTDTIGTIDEVVVTDTIAEAITTNTETDSIESPIYEELITIEPMHKDSRLAWMAMRYYGAKIYWPYLYDANKDCISNPNDIEVGTPIRVPRLTEVQLDTTLQSTIQTLQYLREQAAEAARRHWWNKNLFA